MQIKELPKDLYRKTQIKEFVWLWELVVIWIIGLRMEKFNLEESTCYIPQRTVIWKIFTSFFPSSNNCSACLLTPSSSSPASPHGRQLLKAASAPLRSPLLIYPPSCLGLQKLGRVPAGTVFSAQRYKATGIGNFTNNASKLWTWMWPRNGYLEREQLCVTDPACVSISQDFPCQRRCSWWILLFASSRVPCPWRLCCHGQYPETWVPVRGPQRRALEARRKASNARGFCGSLFWLR